MNVKKMSLEEQKSDFNRLMNNTDRSIARLLNAQKRLNYTDEVAANAMGIKLETFLKLKSGEISEAEWTERRARLNDPKVWEAAMKTPEYQKLQEVIEERVGVLSKKS